MTRFCSAGEVWQASISQVFLDKLEQQKKLKHDPIQYENIAFHYSLPLIRLANWQPVTQYSGAS